MKKKKTKKEASGKRSVRRTTPGTTASKKSTVDASALCVVGIGSSAGGLEALEKFFDHLAPNSGAAFVIIQHLDPARKSIMPELLSRHTEMPVVPAEHRMLLMPNTVYVIPPGKYLSLFHQTLHLSNPDKDQEVRFPIDRFFRALAEDCGPRAVCIILSGTGTDGTLGVKAVKAAGGMTMVQEENSAKHSGMPRSAVATGSVDRILPVEEMPKELIRYVRHPYILKGALEPQAVEPTFLDRLDKIFMIIRSQTGHDFSLYKRNTISRRIERRMALLEITKIADYIRYLQQNRAEVDALYKEFLIAVTSFFRDPEAFDALQKVVLPAILQGKDPEGSVRIWDAGCTTGEEAYSLAILLAEEMERLGRHYKVQIFATDIDEEALDFARAGLYPDSIAVDVSAQRLSRFFEKEENNYRVKKQIREMIIFAKQDLIKDPPFSKLDLAVCRNVLIYLGGVLQKKIIPLFYYTLNPGGYLMLGPSETIGEYSNLFALSDKKWKIFYKKSSPRVPVGLPAVPLATPTEEFRGKKREDLFPKADLAQAADKLLLDEYAPPSVIVNEKFEIVHFRGQTGPYLELPTGAASFNILKMVNEELRIELRSALHKVFTKREKVARSQIRFEGEGKVRTIRLTVQSFPQKTMEGLAMVIFEEIATLPSGDLGQAADRPVQVDQRTNDLENELNATKESLQMTIEELETSNEELQSTNEELQSTNEEMQSSNEELETSKEELQSINEELVTVNAELQNKIEELSQSNNDMLNLLSSTEVGTIFLDNALRIKRFTPATTKIIPLIPSDFGRPISHIAANLLYENLSEDISQVLRTLIFKQKELQTREGEWYLMKIFPYRTEENRIDGAIITFINISEFKKIEAALQAHVEYTNRLTEAIGQPLVVLNKRLRLLSANDRFYRIFQIRKEESDGQLLFNLAGGRMNIPALKNVVEEMVEGGSPDRVIEVEHPFSHIGKKRLKIDLHRIKLKEKAVLGEEELILLLFEELASK